MAAEQSVLGHAGRDNLEEDNAEAANHQHQQRFSCNLKLPEFWSAAPVICFARAELRFEVAGVQAEREMFTHAVKALSQDASRLMTDLITNPPSSTADLSLAVDASDSHIGAVLQQHNSSSSSNTLPLAFFSVKLDNAQRKYSAFDRELLAIYLSIRHFWWLLDGRKFCVLSDHKPLSFALHHLTDTWSARQKHQLSYIAEFTSDVRHVASKANVVADALSCPAAAVAAPSGQSVDYAQLAEAQTELSADPLSERQRFSSDSRGGSTRTAAVV